MSKLSRLAQIASYARRARSPADAVRLAALGYARGHPFDGPDLPARVARGIWPRMVVSPVGIRPLRLELDPTDRGDLDSFEEIVVERLYDFTLVPFEPDYVLDCGAHIGLFSLIAARRYPSAKLIAFEPNPRNAAAVRRQVALNPDVRLDLREAAVSTREGDARFAAAASNAGGLRDRPGSYTVRTVDLRAEIAATGAQRLVLKIDIEGEEERVIPAIAPSLPADCVIFFETHRGEAGFTDSTRSLVREGFKLGRQRERGLYIDGWAVRTRNDRA